MTTIPAPESSPRPIFSDEEIDTLIDYAKKAYDQASYTLNSTEPFQATPDDPDDKWDTVLFLNTLKTRVAVTVAILRKLDALREYQLSVEGH